MGNRNSEMQEDWHKKSLQAPGTGEADDDFDELEGDDEDFSDTFVLDSKDDDDSDNVGATSVEIDAEQLLAEVEAEAAHGVDPSGRVRRRLEAIMERKRRHMDLIDFDEYDLDS
jgi:hypothetical protein